jgi:uncharacterized protein (TIRG00374 family)
MPVYKKLAGLALGLLALVLLIKVANPGAIAKYVSHLNPYYIVAAAATEVIGGVLYSFAWFILFKPSGVKTSIRQAYFMTMGSLFLIYTTPTGIAAEAMRIQMAKKHAEGDYGGPAASVVVHRLLYALGFVTVAGTATGLVYGALSTSPLIRTVFYTLITTLVLIGAVAAIAVKANMLKGITKWVASKFGPRLGKLFGGGEAQQNGVIDRAFDNFQLALKKISKSPARVLSSYAVISVRWILVSVVALLVMDAIGYHGISIWAIMIVMMIAELVSTTPIGVPGMLGILDAAIIGSYTALGVPLPIAAATDLLTRVVLYLVNIPLTGTLFYFYVRKSGEGNEKAVEVHEPPASVAVR